MQLKALPGTFYRAWRLQPTELSPAARERLRWLKAWEALRDKGLTRVGGRRARWHVPPAMVGRILSSLNRRGILLEPPRRRVSATRRRPRRPYAIRKPREYQACQPGA